MVESLMLIALGFLTATLFALIAIQLAWRRAVTVTTRKLTGDLDLEQMQQNTEKLAALEVSLGDKEQELADLSARRAELEDALATASNEAQLLRHDIDALQTQHEIARGEAESHLQNVRTLQSRVDELETAARAEIDRRGLIETQIRNLGEKAARLALEMNEAVSQIADGHGLEAALSAPHVESASTRHQREAVAPITLAPFPTDEAQHNSELPELAEIKASLKNFSESVQPDFSSDDADGDDSGRDAPLPNEHFLADRIRALEAGVAS